MDITQSTKQLEQFRDRLYRNIDNRADTVMELVDAISSMPQARSVVEYSLAESYRRSYSTIFKAIDEIVLPPKLLPELLGPFLQSPFDKVSTRLNPSLRTAPEGLPFWLLGVDVTPQPRLYAHTLQDRSMVYEPTVVKGNKPVTIGHQYSTVALLPDEEDGLTSSWVVPLATQRVASDADKELVGAQQIDALLQDGQLPFGHTFSVEVGDTSYSKPAYLHAHRKHKNLVTIARVRSNRTFYRQYQPADNAVAGAGHPTWYGAAFALSDPDTWGETDDTLALYETSRRGHRYRVEIQAWHNLLMTGKQKPSPLPMHRHPFTLLRIVRYDEQGKMACLRPLWLLVIGERRHELTLLQSYTAYRRRFNLEHFFRFGKQKLQLTGFQTPEVKREENWWQLTHIAYAQLWMARHLADCLPRPWERNLPSMRRHLISPSLVQRDFARIIRQLGTPAQPPKHRGISPGRRPGTRLPPRPRQKVVVKSQIHALSP